MEKNIFKLDNEQLKGIAHAFREKVEEGLNKNNAEIQCIPTFILPKATDVKGKALVLDLGGTNYRVAIVDFSTEKPIIYPNNGWKKDMSIMKSPGYTREELFKELADLIVEIKREEEMPIGYCFSYPTESIPGGDARLLRWTKGVDIREMVGQFVGKPLLDYLNEKNKIRFTGVKVLNDTIASLFAGLTDKSYDAYIGLIVGTGTNMATFIPSDKITKLDPECHVQGLIPVNLESGNFYPPFLTAVDDTVDATSDSLGKQRIMNYPDIHKDIYVQVAHWIYNRSAQLVAASLAGLIALLKSYNRDIHRVCLIAEGSLFWSESRKDKNYNILVMEKLQELLRELELEDVEVHINSMDNANLIGTGIAALS